MKQVRVLAVTLFVVSATSGLRAGGLEYNTNRGGSDFWNFELDSGADACAAACAGDARCRAFTWVRPGVQGARARCWLKNAVPGATNDNNCISGVMQAASTPGSGPGSAGGAWGVWAYQLGADGVAWNPCDIQYVAARRPARYDSAPNYRLVRDADTRADADRFVSLFSRFFDDQPDFVVKLAPCNPDTRVFTQPPAGNPPARPVYRRGGQSAGLEYGVNRAGSDYRAFELDAGAAACEQACVADGACNAFTWVKPGVQGARARCWLKNRVPGASRDSNCVSGVVR